MKNIYKSLLLVLLFSVSKINAQMTCIGSPSLGVYNDVTDAPISATIPCNYPDFIYLHETNWVIGNTGSVPCIRIIVNTPVNAVTNNSIVGGQGTNTNVVQYCPTCFSVVPSSTTWTASLYGVDPAQGHGYNICNINAGASFPYTVTSCYNNVPITSGIYANTPANSCQTITIPAGTPLGMPSWTISPAIAPTASFVSQAGYCWLDTYLMTAGIYTVSYSFNTQGPAGVCSTLTRTISITNPYTSGFTPAGPLCANAACVLPGTITGSAGGTFTATSGMSGGNFCPSLVGAGSWPVTYTVGVSPQCGSSTTNSITVNALPIANAGATQSLTCVNITTVLAGSGGGTYSWTGPSIVSGATSANPVVGGPGVYSLTVNSGGCTSLTSTVAVGFNTLAPTPTVSTTGSVTCTNSVISLGSLPAGMTYTWTAPAGSSITGGVNSQSTTASGPGTYTVRIVNPANGCSTITTIAANINNAAPTGLNALTSGSVTCNNNAINLTTTLTGVTYTWTAPGGSSITSGTNAASATGSGPGTYTVKVQSAVNGCTAQATVAALINQSITPVSASTTASVTCTSSVVNLFSNPSTGVTYTWTAPGGSSITGGVNTQTTTGSGPGTYTVRITDAVNGCTNIATVAAVINTVAPVGVSANATSSITCTSQTLSLAGAPGSGGTYTWVAPAGGSITGGVNSQNTTANGAGTYTLIFGSATNGCTAQATVAAPFNTVAPVGVTASATSSITCASTTFSLSGAPTSGGTYTWTAPIGSSISGGVNSANTTGTGPGTYTVVFQSSVNGCTAQATTSAPFNTLAPTGISASTSGTVTCGVGAQAINLGVTPTGLTYSWTAPAGSSITSGATSSSATGNGGGTYSVVVTGTNGCSAPTSTVAANTNTTPPAPTINTPSVLTCGTTTVTLTGNPSSGVLYNWSGPGIISSTNQSTVNVISVGTYSLIVTSAVNNCTNIVTASVANNTIVPTVNAGSNQTVTCASPSVTLIGTANPSSCTPVWSGPSVCGGGTTYNATVCGTGTYVLTATNPANGCSATSSVVVGSNGLLPSATTVDNGTITCVNTSVQIVATTTTAPATYSWTGPGITSGATTATVNVNTGGSYSVVITGTNGCPGTFIHNITNDNTPLTVTSAASNTITCSTTSINLSSTVTPAGTFTYSWSGPGIVGTNTLSTATASLGGTYTVSVTNTSNGCTGTTTLGVNSSTSVPTGVAVSPPSFTLSCTNPTTAITATAIGASTYSWVASGPGVITSGGTSATANVSGSGTYSVIVTGTNGCSAAAAIATVAPNAGSPSFVLSNTSPSITCLSSNPTISVNVTSTVGISSYSWSPASGISGSTTGSVVTFTTAGTFTCAITATNGCTSFPIVTVTSATAAPMFVAGTATANNLSCANPTVIISPAYTPSTGITFSWSGPGIVSGTTSSSVAVNQNGQYSVTVTNTVTGCSSTSLTADVFGTTTIPTVTIASSSSIGLGCSSSNSTNTLTANASAAVTYSWSTGATTQTISVNSPGIYTVVVTNTTTSCSSTETISVLSNTAAPTATSVASAIMPCGGTATVTLNGGSPDPSVIYAWTGPGTITGSNTGTPIVDTPGSFTLTVTNTITGCSSSTVVNVGNSTPVATFTPDITSGFAPQVVVFTNGSTSTPSVTYTWSFGDGNTATTYNASNTYTLAGTYNVTLTVSSGVCVATATAVIVIEDGFSLEIPNVFTPNNDKSNDVFTITSTGVKEIQLQIFNRWGQLMYDFVGAKAAWDGITNNGQEASAGTYYYFVIATGHDGKEVKKNGAVSLFR